jgi:hypothetical protein
MKTFFIKLITPLHVRNPRCAILELSTYFFYFICKEGPCRFLTRAEAKSDPSQSEFKRILALNEKSTRRDFLASLDVFDTRKYSIIDAGNCSGMV